MKNKKVLIISICALIVLAISGIIIWNLVGNNINIPVEVYSENDGQDVKQEVVIYKEEPKKEIEKESIDRKVDIVDLESNSRPYALIVNNTDIAVKVQEGLNKAYLVYEVPTEGNTSRLIALYKDIKEDLVIGTIRSARHNFVDFALESDAIFCCFGWSHYAQRDMQSGSIDYLQGLYGEPFYRNNPEGLVLEHTAYTSMHKLINAVQAKGFRTTSNNSILLNYNYSDVDLYTASNKQIANKVIIPYGAAPQIASFIYDSKSKMYIRYENGIKCLDHNTKEEVSTKNIIVQKIGYSVCADNYYWNLNTVGAGVGYYITNGISIPIKWEKLDRKSKTKYTYIEGTVIDGKDVSGQEILVSDGRTWIEVQTTSQILTIE